MVLLGWRSTERKKGKSAFQLIFEELQEASTMTPQLIQPAKNSIEVELDQLAYSAYLLTLDLDLALSVVMAALDAPTEERTSNGDLLRRTIEMSLAQLRLDSSAASDRESLAIEALLYSDSSFATSKLALSLKEQTNGNPILLLERSARIAFVLTHVLGYSINRAATMAQVSEKEYLTQLRNAYRHLASLQLGADRTAGSMLGQMALA